MEHKCLSPWKGAAAGGAIVFIWSALSWMVLPWHDKTLNSFSDPAPVVNAVTANAPRSGIYVLRNDSHGQAAPTDPFIFLSIRRAGWGAMGRALALGLLVQMFGAFYWTWILGKIPGLTLRDAALYGLFFGLCVGVLGSMPNWVWWKFSLPFSLLYVADAVIGWTAASVVIARYCQASICALPSR